MPAEVLERVQNVAMLNVDDLYPPEESIPVLSVDDGLESWYRSIGPNCWVMTVNPSVCAACTTWCGPVGTYRLCGC